MRQNHRIIKFDALILHLIVMFVAHIFKSRRRLEAENLFLRHHLNIGSSRFVKLGRSGDAVIGQPPRIVALSR